MQAAGKRNRQLLIEQRSGRDSIGQPSQTWTTLATVWAQFIAPRPSATAQVQADKDVSTAAFVARIGYRTDITIAMRATEGATVYEIAQVVPDVAAREYTDIVLVSGVN